MNEIVIISTTDTMEMAQKIADALIQESEAACVNIIPGIRSIYRWQAQVCNDSEFLLLIKSSTEKFEAVRSTIRRLHSYQIPEVLALPITAGDSDYLSWLRVQLGNSGEMMEKDKGVKE
jgi:periplasmic divalent cation tolerance protein